MTKRQRVYSFLDLPSHVQEKRAKDLGIWQEKDRDLIDPEKFVLWAKRAKESGCVDKLFPEE